MNPTSHPIHTRPAQPQGRVPFPQYDPGAIVAALPDLAASTDPVAVFTSMAELCVPAFADACHISVSMTATGIHTTAGHHILFPSPADDQPEPAGTLADTTVTVTVREPDSDDGPGYHATLTFAWHQLQDPGPSAVLIAQLLADRCGHLIRCERLAARAQRDADRAANLQIALDTNRGIGQAMGILMVNFTLTGPQAFDVLRKHSQDSNRKLRDICADIVEMGTLQTLPPQPQHTELRTNRHLESDDKPVGSPCS